jgi:metallo-beta-lactamase family protein
MRLTFLGAAGTVTGSCHLLEAAGARILLDCGMHQGGREASALNAASFPFAPAAITAVVLSHAHIDHSGLLPRLVREGFRGRVYATPATRELVAVMLKDSAHLQLADATRRARHGRAAVAPLYGFDDVERLVGQIVTVPYEAGSTIHPGIDLRLHDAGHILGSAIVELRLEEGGSRKTLVFSGDLGQPGRPILNDPTPVTEADLLLLESTYGDRDHKPLEATVDELATLIRRAIQEKHGNVLIPAFAVGRTQEILYWLERLTFEGRIPALDVFVDSPLATEISSITRRHQELYNEAARALYGAVAARGSRCHVRYTHSVQESMALNRVTGGAVIISASGMCDGGRIRHHLMHHLPNPHTTVVISGFQAAGTLGRRLVNGEREVYIDGVRVRVNAEIATLGGFSAHAGQTELVGWLRHFERPPAIWLVHGEPSASAALADRIESDLGWEIEGVATQGQVVEFGSPGLKNAPRASI